VGRQGDQLEDDLGKHTQGAFRADHQPGEVIAGGALDGSGSRFDQVAFHIEKTHTHDVVAGDTVFQPAQAAGIFGHIAADGGDRLAAGIGRVEQALGFHGSGQFGGDHTGLDHGVHIRFVDFEDGVHSVGNDHHAAGKGHGATAQIGAGAANGERQAVFIAKAHRLTQRFSRRGPHDQARAEPDPQPRRRKNRYAGRRHRSTRYRHRRWL
jgi:hypothetical protein